MSCYHRIIRWLVAGGCTHAPLEQGFEREARLNVVNQNMLSADTST
jgi:hypothetical protein